LWKCGKTTLIAHLLREFGRGGNFLDRRVMPTRVLYITEESEARWAKRRDALGMGDWISFRVQPFVFKPSWSDWEAFLGDVRAEVEREQIGLVVFDTLDKLWPVMKENDAGEVARALMPLRKLGAATLLNHHLKKGDGKEATGSRGSGELTAFVDTIVEMRRFNPDQADDRRRVLTGYGRSDAVPAELVVELAKDGGGYTVHGAKAAVASTDLRQLIVSCLPFDPPGFDFQKIFDLWPTDAAVRRKTLKAELNAGVKDGRWRRTGEGKKGDPYRFHRLPLAPENAVPGPGNGNDSGTGTGTESDRRGDDVIRFPGAGLRPDDAPEADSVPGDETPREGGREQNTAEGENEPEVWTPFD
jgi:hypothetical protein